MDILFVRYNDIPSAKQYTELFDQIGDHLIAAYVFPINDARPANCCAFGLADFHHLTDCTVSAHPWKGKKLGSHTGDLFIV